MTEWRAIPGYEGRYEVSDEGQVRSLLRGGPHLLKHGVHARQGYRYVNLRPGGGQPYKTWHVHRLVLLAFVGPLPSGKVSRHLDGDGGNNRLCNLTYGTRSENGFDCVRHGRHFRGGLRRATPAVVAAARNLLAHLSGNAVASILGVSPMTISRIKNSTPADEAVA